MADARSEAGERERLAALAERTAHLVGFGDSDSQLVHDLLRSDAGLVPLDVEAVTGWMVRQFGHTLECRIGASMDALSVDVGAPMCQGQCRSDDASVFVSRFGAAGRGEERPADEPATVGTDAGDGVVQAPSPAPAVPSLLPCPFCGGAAMVLGDHDSFNPNFKLCRAQCINDDCAVSGRNFETREQAAETWNRRVPAPSLGVSDD